MKICMALGLFVFLTDLLIPHTFEEAIQQQSWHFSLPRLIDKEPMRMLVPMCSKAMSGLSLVLFLQCASLTATLFASYESEYSVLSRHKVQAREASSVRCCINTSDLYKSCFTSAGVAPLLARCCFTVPSNQKLQGSRGVTTVCLVYTWYWVGGQRTVRFPCACRDCLTSENWACNVVPPPQSHVPQDFRGVGVLCVQKWGDCPCGPRPINPLFHGSQLWTSPNKILSGFRVFFGLFAPATNWHVSRIEWTHWQRHVCTF